MNSVYAVSRPHTHRLQCLSPHIFRISLPQLQVSPQKTRNRIWVSVCMTHNWNIPTSAFLVRVHALVKAQLHAQFLKALPENQNQEWGDNTE